MEKPISDQFENQAKRYLEKVGERYVFDATSGLYKQKTSEAGNKAQQSGNDRHSPFWVDIRRDWLVLCISLLTLILIAFTVYYTRKQWVATYNTFKEISKQTTASQESAEASDRSSLVSQRAERESERYDASQSKQSANALQTNVDNFKLDQRAWIGLCDFGMHDFAKGKPIRVQLKFCNSGKTPARKVQQGIAFVVEPNAFQTPTKENFEGVTFQPAHAVPPQGSLVLLGGRGGDVIPESDAEKAGQLGLDTWFDRILDKTYVLYYFGSLKYRDNSGHPRETKFCVYLGDPEAKELRYCSQHNELN